MSVSLRGKTQGKEMLLGFLLLKSTNLMSFYMTYRYYIVYIV